MSCNRGEEMVQEYQETKHEGLLDFETKTDCWLLMGQLRNKEQVMSLN